MSVKLIESKINSNVPVLGTGAGGKVLSDINSGACIQFGEYSANDITLSNDQGAYLKEVIWLSDDYIEIVRGGVSALNFAILGAGGAISVGPSPTTSILQARDIYVGGESGTTKIGFFGTALQTQPAAIAKPAAGATIDAEARAAVDLIIDLLSAAGGGFGITA